VTARRRSAYHEFGPSALDLEESTPTGPIAAIPVTQDPKALFNKLMIWGLSMTVVGAIVCFVLFGLLGIP
jgi:hypothetical protein